MKNTWTPCREALPVKSGKYLVTRRVHVVPDHINQKSYYVDVTEEYFDSNRKVWFCDGPVYAWMLSNKPVPYEITDEDKEFTKEKLSVGLLKDFLKGTDASLELELEVLTDEEENYAMAMLTIYGDSILSTDTEDINKETFTDYPKTEPIKISVLKKILEKYKDTDQIDLKVFYDKDRNYAAAVASINGEVLISGNSKENY